MDTFQEDLKKGNEYEDKHLTLIQKKFPDAYRIQGYCKDWDIFIPSQNYGVEVKVDWQVNKTGNWLVEIEFNGKPSALATTKAKYWVLDKTDEWMVVEVEKLREFVKPYPIREFIGRGDTKPKKAYFIKWFMLRNIKVLAPWVN